MPKITVARPVDAFTGETVHEVQVDAADFMSKVHKERARLREDYDILKEAYEDALQSQKFAYACILYEQMTEVHLKWLELGRV